jgi:hypothetical protein
VVGGAGHLGFGVLGSKNNYGEMVVIGRHTRLVVRTLPTFQIYRMSHSYQNTERVSFGE